MPKCTNPDLDAASNVDQAEHNLDIDTNMLDGESKKKSESPVTAGKLKKGEIKKPEKKEGDDPKPRIVLTFRSEKPGAKSSNMKIVSNEEKHEDVSPRRSSRTRGAKCDSDDDMETSLKKNNPISENDEASDSSHTTPKRSTRRRSKEFSDNVLANAIARKEKSYETSAPTQRLSRRIKPTAKALANKELRIGMESQNNARLGIQAEKSPEEGVRTRRSARPSTIADSMSGQDRKPPKRNREQVDAAAEDLESESDDKQSQNSVMKLKHLCELGLKLKADPAQEEEENDMEDRDEECEEGEPEVPEDDDEIDDDTEVINKLLEEDTSEDTDGDCDEDFMCSEVVSRRTRPRRSSRLQYTFGSLSCAPSSPEEEQKSPSPRRKKMRAEESQLEIEPEENSSNPAGGEEGSEAAGPPEDSRIIATCFCEEPSNVYAAPSELIEPVFCQAIEMVDEVRVGCSHGARMEEDGSYGPLLRAGPRAPFFMACKLHTMQLAKHMCCPACGLFCTQGIFYQCSEGHLFHVECGLPYSEAKGRGGCPHCGVQSYCWRPANKRCTKVKVEMHCSNRRVFLPEQREQCTQSYLGFSTLSPSVFASAPVVPPELLPCPPVDLKRLCERPAEPDQSDLAISDAEQAVYDAIVAGETADQLIPKIMRMRCINRLVGGWSCTHAAARRGHLAALYLLQYAGCDLNVLSADALTPLMAAVHVLCDKSDKRTSPKSMEKNTGNVEAMDVEQKDELTEKEIEKVEKTEMKDEEHEDRPSDEDLMKVIRYLVAAGCDVNIPGAEGMRALHVAARHGSEELCEALLPAAEVDARDHGGWTPLVWAADHRHHHVLRLLLRSGAEPHPVDGAGNAAVHWCALAGSSAALQLLLDAAPHAVYAANAHGDTPLHVAARQGHYSCVVMLLARGAPTEAENVAGELPVEVCAGACQTAVSLNMQMALSARAASPRRLLLTDISRGREHWPLPCVNEVDAEPAPADFTYVTRHVTPAPLALDTSLDTMQGCSCAEGSCGDTACACCVLGVRRWSARGRLLPAFPYHEPPMLFECNQSCGCHAKRCDNQLVTRASRLGSVFVRAQVYRAGGALGWGLRAAEPVPRGAPVATYCGELLPLPDADARPADHYMFSLDVKRDLLDQCVASSVLCVDAARFGGAARFVNHSCAPNLAPVRVFTATRDLRLPDVVLFAARPVAAGEPFTFDYGDKFWSVKSKLMRCECGSEECRYPVKNSDDES